MKYRASEMGWTCLGHHKLHGHHSAIAGCNRQMSVMIIGGGTTQMHPSNMSTRPICCHHSPNDVQEQKNGRKERKRRWQKADCGMHCSRLAFPHVASNDH